jgi:hypothetical protein
MNEKEPTKRFSADLDAGLSRQIVGQPLQRPHRIGLSQGSWPMSDGLEQLLFVLLGHVGRRPRLGPIVQPVDPLLPRACEPAPDRFIIFTHDRRNGRSRQVLLDGSEHHLPAGAHPHISCAPIQVFSGF